jgi:hypothetical protein
MIRVISSPSISTTGFFTLIFAMSASHLLRIGSPRSRGAVYQRHEAKRRDLSRSPPTIGNRSQPR